jgi:predicted metal-dependent phosphotriesterase family hydrolase
MSIRDYDYIDRHINPRAGSSLRFCNNSFVILAPNQRSCAFLAESFGQSLNDEINFSHHNVIGLQSFIKHKHMMHVVFPCESEKGKF